MVPRSWRDWRLPLLGIALLVVTVYARSIVGNAFVSIDDGVLIYRNPIVRGVTLANIRASFSTYDPELYVPLTFLSYQLDYAVGGLAPPVYHATNLLLHALNAVLVALLVLRLTGRRWAALAAGTIFAIHPLHTEAVAWAAARKDLLSSTFFLLTVLSYLRWREDGRRRRYVASIIWFLLGLLAKVSIVVAPVILLLIDWLQGRRLERRAWIEKAPHAALSIVFGIVAIAGKSGGGALVLERALLGAKAAMFYLWKLAVPINLSVLYPYTKPITLAQPDLFFSLLALIALFAFAWLLRHRARSILFAWTWYLLLLAPSFVNVAKGQEVMRDVYFGSDRYAYLASIGVFLAACLAVDAVVEKKPRIIRFLCSLGVLGILGTLTFRQSLVWRNTETLMAHALALYPNAHLAHSYRGQFLHEKGDDEGAVTAYRASLRIRPNATAAFSMGVSLERLGRIPEALAAYEEALAVSPGDLQSLINLGVLLLRTGQPERALLSFERAVEIDPALAIGHFNLGQAYEELGRPADSLAAYRRVIELDPGDAEAMERVRALGGG